MANINQIQASFTGGEISPRLLARVDFDTYTKSAKTMKNAYSLIHGGIKRRNGTITVSEILNYRDGSILIPYTNSRTNSYSLLFNNNKIQFIKDKAFVQNLGNNLEITSPYNDDELSELHYAQSGNILFITHANHSPKQLKRISDTNWTLSDIAFENGALSDYWFESAYVNFKIIAGQTDFEVGDHFYFISDGSGSLSTQVTKANGFVGSGDLINVSVDAGLDVIAGQQWDITCTVASKDRWEFSVIGDVTGTPISTWSPNDYPNAVSFFDQRLIFGGSPSHPQHIWGSATGDYTNFTNGILDSDAFTFQIASNNFDEILHLSSTRQLVPLTFGGEFSMAGGALSGITPTSVKIQSHTFHGSSTIKPIRIGQELLFIQRGELKARAISYDVNQDANVASDITVLAEHITESGLRAWTFAQDPDYIVWAVRNDGTLVSVSHDRDQGITAWAQHDTAGLFKNVVSIPSATNDDVYMIVERTIDGVTSHFVEYFDGDTYTDSAVKQTYGTPTDTINNLQNLDGATVSIRVDGKVHPPKLVSGGSLTLDYLGSDVEVGLPFTTTIEMLHPKIALPDGTLQGRNLSIRQAVLRLQDTVGLTVDDKSIPIMTTTEILDAAPTPFTGDIKVNLTGWSSSTNLKIEQTIPAPFQLLGVILKLNTGTD